MSQFTIAMDRLSVKHDDVERDLIPFIMFAFGLFA